MTTLTKRNASTETCRVGWEYFIGRKNPDNVTIEQVNAALARKHREPISQRTYNHYKTMYNTSGTGDYMSINRFAVLRSVGGW